MIFSKYSIDGAYVPLLRNDLIALLSVASVAMLIASWALRNEWWGDLLLQVGSAAALFIPFLLLTRWLESRLGRANEEAMDAISSTQKAVENLEQEFARVEMARSASEIDTLIAQRLDDRHKADRDLFKGIALAPSREDVVLALHRAAEMGIIASFGVRVAIGGSTGLYLWFRPNIGEPADQDRLAITVQKWNLVPVMEIRWEPRVSVVDFMLNLGAKLRDTHYWTGDAGFRPGEALAALSKILLFGLDAITKGETDLASRIFEVVEDDWIVAEDALLHPTQFETYSISYDRLNHTNWQRHMQEKAWVNQGVFQKALDVAICLVADGIAEGQRPEYLEGVWKSRSRPEASAGTDS